MKKGVLALVLVPALGYGGYLATLALPAAERSAEFSERINKLGGHAEAGAQLLRERGPSAVPFHDACKSVVTPVEKLQVFAYYGQPDETALAPLGNQAKYFPARQVFALKAAGLARWDTTEEVKHSSLPWRPRGALQFFEDLLTSPPGEHAWRKNRWNEPFNHPLAEVRYLLVHQLEALTPPRVIDGQSYAPGSMTFHSGLFNASTGERLCDGRTTLAQTGKVELRGRGKTQEEAQADLAQSRDGAVVATFVFQTYEFSLGSACALGGAALCQATGYPVASW